MAEVEKLSYVGSWLNKLRLGIPHRFTAPAMAIKTGDFELTYGAAPTEPVTAAYTHTDYTDFVSPAQSTSFTPGGGEGTGGTPANLQLSFGRVVPGSISFTDGGGDTFVDDGKGTSTSATFVIDVIRVRRR